MFSFTIPSSYGISTLTSPLTMRTTPSPQWSKEFTLLLTSPSLGPSSTYHLRVFASPTSLLTPSLFLSKSLFLLTPLFLGLVPNFILSLASSLVSLPIISFQNLYLLIIFQKISPNLFMAFILLFLSTTPLSSFLLLQTTISTNSFLLGVPHQNHSTL